MGRGLVEPVDQMHSANPATHPDLLDWLAVDFMEGGWDVKRVLRQIVTSGAVHQRIGAPAQVQVVPGAGEHRPGTGIDDDVAHSPF